MPMMLDGTVGVDLQDVDDLFGDAVGLGLPVNGERRQLKQRLEELRLRGCNQSVAWSRSGTIASIAQDGLSLELRYLHTKLEDGSWGLSEPNTCHLVSGTASTPLVHLEWSATTIPELAVFDAVGRVALLAFPIALNHPYLTRNWDSDSMDDLNSAVGCFWLPSAPPNPQRQNTVSVLHGPAVKHGPGYHYENSFTPAAGPTYPHPSKSALLSFTAGARLRMFWTQVNNKPEETTLEMDGLCGADQIFTHAAMVPDNKSLLLACVSTSDELNLARVDLHWDINAPSAADKSMVPQSARMNPSLSEKVLATTSLHPLQSDDSTAQSPLAQLSHLRILPSVVDGTAKVSSPAQVIAFGLDETLSQSVIYRWEVQEEAEKLHPAFLQLGNREGRGSSEGSPDTTMRRLQPVYLNRVVIAVHTIHLGRVVILTFADGSVEFRDRSTFEELWTSEDLDRVTHLKQVGWNFEDAGSCLQVAFSPSFYTMVLVDDDGKLKCNRMQPPPIEMGDGMDNSRYAATVAGLTVAAASVLWGQQNYDDLLAIVKPLTSKKQFTHDWICELFRMLKIQVDYSEETTHDSLVRNSLLQYSMSVMHSLGFRGQHRGRSFQSKLSNIFLNVRNIAILITLASNTPANYRDKISPLDEHEVVNALAGCVQWTLVLLAWITDSLFDLMNDDEFLALLNPERFSEIQPYLREKNEVSLHLLLSSSTRGYLSAMCHRIVHLQGLSTKAIEYYRRQASNSGGIATPQSQSFQLQQAYQRVHKISSSSLVKVAEFDKLLGQVTTDVREAYNTALPNMVRRQSSMPQGKGIENAIKAARIQWEQLLLVSASLPPFFLPLLKKLLTSELPSFRKHTDPSKLFFADYSLLELDDDEGSLATRQSRAVNVDVFRRSLIRPSPNQQWRRCVRCTAVMEDIAGGSRPGFTFVLRHQQRCLCGGSWALIPSTGKM